MAEIDGVVSNIPNDKSAYVTAYVAEVEVLYFIDSGAQVTTITSDSFNAILQSEAGRSNLHELTYGSDKSLRGYASQGYIDVKATFSVELFVSDERPKTIDKFYVVRESKALDTILPSDTVYWQ